MTAPRDPAPKTAENGRVRARATGEDLRIAILSEARRVITQQGFHALSTRRIADAVGCTATSIYIYFQSKDALLHAVIDEGMQALHTRLEAARLGPGAAPERVARMARAYAEFGLGQPTLYEVMFMLHPKHMERYPAEAYRRARKNVEALAAILAEADGGVHGGTASLARATTAWAALHGHIALWIAGRIDASIPLDSFIEGAVHLVRRMLAQRD